MHGYGQEHVSDGRLDRAVFPPSGARPLSIGSQRCLEGALALVGLDGERLGLPRFLVAEREVQSGDAQREAACLRGEGCRSASFVRMVGLAVETLSNCAASGCGFGSDAARCVAQERGMHVEVLVAHLDGNARAARVPRRRRRKPCAVPVGDAAIGFAVAEPAFLIRKRNSKSRDALPSSVTPCDERKEHAPCGWRASIRQCHARADDARLAARRKPQRARPKAVRQVEWDRPSVVGNHDRFPPDGDLVRLDLPPPASTENMRPPDDGALSPIPLKADSLADVEAEDDAADFTLQRHRGRRRSFRRLGNRRSG